jgi:hypothetical protein
MHLSFHIMLGFISSAPSHVDRLKAFSRELAESHSVNDTPKIKKRMKIAFTLPPVGVVRKGRQPGWSPGNPPKKKAKRNDEVYRNRRTHKAYVAALKHGSCFFFALLNSFSKLDSTVQLVNSLSKEIATTVPFSLDTDSQKVFLKWAKDGGYGEQKSFIQFMKGLQWLEGLLFSYDTV